MIVVTPGKEKLLENSQNKINKTRTRVSCSKFKAMEIAF